MASSNDVRRAFTQALENRKASAFLGFEILLISFVVASLVFFSTKKGEIFLLIFILSFIAFSFLLNNEKFMTVFSFAMSAFWSYLSWLLAQEMGFSVFNSAGIVILVFLMTFGMRESGRQYFRDR